MDLGIEVILKLFSGDGLNRVFELSEENDDLLSENAERILSLKAHYLKCVEEVIPFLQGKRATLARQICSDGFSSSRPNYRYTRRR